MKLAIKNSALVNKSISEEQVPKTIDNKYIETAIYSLWKIDLLNLIKTKAILAKEIHIQPSEIDLMPYWEYETFLIDINDIVKEENDKQEATMNKYDINGAMKMAKPGGMQKTVSGMMPKTP